MIAYIVVDVLNSLRGTDLVLDKKDEDINEAPINVVRGIQQGNKEQDKHKG